MRNNEPNKPDDFSKKRLIVLGVIFILEGVYGVLQVGYGWSILLFGLVIIFYGAPTETA